MIYLIIGAVLLGSSLLAFTAVFQYKRMCSKIIFLITKCTFSNDLERGIV